jgi:hypothetical protein
VAAVDGLAGNGYDLSRWLAHHDMPLTWRGPNAVDFSTEDR